MDGWMNELMDGRMGKSGWMDENLAALHDSRSPCLMWPSTGSSRMLGYMLHSIFALRHAGRRVSGIGVAFPPQRRPRRERDW